MRTTLVAGAALAGGLLLSPLGPTQAGSAPDLKNAVRAIHESAIINGDWDYHNHQAHWDRHHLANLDRDRGYSCSWLRRQAIPVGGGVMKSACTTRLA